MFGCMLLFNKDIDAVRMVIDITKSWDFLAFVYRVLNSREAVGILALVLKNCAVLK